METRVEEAAQELLVDKVAMALNDQDVSRKLILTI